MPANHALVCVNGECDPKTLLQLSTQSYDMLVAVDGGLRHLEALGWSPDWLIGDLDSIEPEAGARLRRLGTEVLRHPVEKDATDLELALNQLVALGVGRVTLLGMSGGRMDHTLANLLLLGKRHWPFVIDLYSTDGNGRLITCEHPFHENLALDSELSLLPLSGEVTGVNCSGLYYPLLQATIGLGSTLGISNIVTSAAVSVTVSSGSLLLLHNSADIFTGP